MDRVGRPAAYLAENGRMVCEEGVALTIGGKSHAHGATTTTKLRVTPVSDNTPWAFRLSYTSILKASFLARCLLFY